jgi:nitrogen fixation NifU-like protein
MSNRNLTELYQAILLRHSKSPSFYGKLSVCTHYSEGFNPICGDAVTIYLNLEDSIIKESSFESASCAVCKASASIMLEQIKLKTLSQVYAYQTAFEHLLQAQGDAQLEAESILSEDFNAFLGLSQYPSRKNCAKLPWDTLQKALK